MDQNKNNENVKKFLLTDDESVLSEDQKLKLPVYKLYRALFVLFSVLSPLILFVWVFIYTFKESFVLGVMVSLIAYFLALPQYKKLVKAINFQKYNKNMIDDSKDQSK